MTGFFYQSTAEESLCVSIDSADDLFEGTSAYDATSREADTANVDGFEIPGRAQALESWGFAVDTERLTRTAELIPCFPPPL